MSDDEKAFLETETGTRIPCSFNPEQLHVKVSTVWKGDELPGQGTPTLRFGGGGSGLLDVELFFDSTRDGTSVTEHTDKLVRLLQIDSSLSGHDDGLRNGRPPWVRFHWGRFHSFRAVITDLDVTYVLFSAAGEPLRARARLAMKQFAEEQDWPRQNPTSGTPKPSRSHQVQPGETLDRVAAKHYGDATAWRHIARANDIRDPFEIRPGRHLDVPVVEVER